MSPRSFRASAHALDVETLQRDLAVTSARVLVEDEERARFHIAQLEAPLESAARTPS